MQDTFKQARKNSGSDLFYQAHHFIMAGKRGGSPHLSFRANPGSKPLKFRLVLGPFRDLLRADPGPTRGQNLRNQPGVGTGNSRKMRGPTSIARHDFNLRYFVNSNLSFLFLKLEAVW